MANTYGTGASGTQPVSRTFSLVGSFLTLALPIGLLTLVISFAAPSLWTFVGVSLLCSAVYFGFGFHVLHQQEFVVVERFGRLQSVRFGFKAWGFIFVNPVFDRLRMKGNLKAKGIVLYERDCPINFSDGAAGTMHAELWGTVGSPDDIQNQNVANLTKQIIRAAYAFDDADDRRKKAVLSEAVQKIQTLNGDNAKTMIKRVLEEAVDDAEVALVETGFYPLRNTPIVIEDNFEWTPKTQALFEERLQGEKEAEREAAAAQGPIKGIQAVMAARESNPTGFDAAWDVIRTKEGFETIGKQMQNGGHVNIIGLGGFDSVLDAMRSKGVSK